MFGVGAGDRVLVVAPHQDDECIGAGGTLLKWGAEGAVTGVLWVCGTADGQSPGVEATNAAAVLGCTWTRALGAPPASLSPDASWLHGIVGALREFRPSVVLLPHQGEDDRQHRVVAELGREAVWIAAYPVLPQLGDPVGRIRTVLAYEVWTPLPDPAFYSDITAHIPGKERAIASYASQLRIADFRAGAICLNRYRGVTSGAGDFAEAFAVIRLQEGWSRETTGEANRT